MTNAERKVFWDTLCSLKGENIPQEFELLQEKVKIPNYLYRYRAATLKNLEALRTNRLYFSSAEYFDDPFDAFLCINRESAKAEVGRLKNIDDCHLLDTVKEHFSMGIFSKTGNSSHTETVAALTPENIKGIITLFEQEIGCSIENFADNFIVSIQQEIRKRTKAICFSEEEFNEVLWIKYAEQHKGFVLEFDFSQKQGFICSTLEKCNDCAIAKHGYALYPVYYSKEKYEASKLAQNIMIMKALPPDAAKEAVSFFEKSYNIAWELEKVSVIKNICHEYDKEWRALLPQPVNIDHPTLCIVPTSITLGLLMEDAEKNLTITCAKEAGIKNIYQVFINDKSDLDKRLI